MPLNLKPGAIIDVVATSSANFKVSVEEIKGFIKTLGYTPRVPDNFQEDGSDPFSANSDKIRCDNLVTALNASDSEVIWMFRGGYGATRLIPMLDKYDFSAKKKIIIGYSDLTSLAIYFTQKYDWQFVHGAMISNYCSNTPPKQEGLLFTKEILSGNLDTIKYGLTPYNTQAKENFSISSKIIGGNICLIESSLGTNWHINTKEKILFIEEVGERGYRLDRSLQHMYQAGCFEGIKALIIGDIICAPEPNGSSLCEVAIKRFAESLDVAVFRSNQFGHGEQNYPLLFNYDAHLVMGDEPSLFFKKTHNDN
jgi:muramoyltetrapeptide carboxypeptidase